MARDESGKEQPTAPISIRLADEERLELQKAAGDVPLSRYIREQALGAASLRRRYQRRPVQDQEALARILATLGQSDIAQSLRELSNASKIGALIVTPEIERDIQTACRDVSKIRADLMKALGVRDANSRCC